MILSLVGMSNIGKTHWSKKLETLGFARFGCDDEIEKVLGVDDLAAWMGFPDSAAYQDREKEYLEAERAVLESVLSRLDANLGDAVVDTTGSVICLGNDLLARLKEKTKVVYLQAGDDAVGRMAEAFFACPKPLVWGERFRQNLGEGRDQTLRRCYPELLAWRHGRYADLAHLVIPV